MNKTFELFVPKLLCGGCDSPNVFVTEEKLATCRECGCQTEFHYGQVPTEPELKMMILEGCNNDKKAAGDLVKDFFWYKDKTDEEKFASYFNAFIVQNYGFPFRITGTFAPETWPVLTLWEPYATLLAHGLKLIETRPKSINYVGTILIHAAKNSPNLKETMKLEPFKKALASIGILKPEDFHHGHIIGAYDHSHCAKVVAAEIAKTYADDIKSGAKIIPPAEPELSFGDYDIGIGRHRFAWIGQNHRVLENPIPYTNGQGYYLKYKGDLSLLTFKTCDSKHKKTAKPAKNSKPSPKK